MGLVGVLIAVLFTGSCTLPSSRIDATSVSCVSLKLILRLDVGDGRAALPESPPLNLGDRSADFGFVGVLATAFSSFSSSMSMSTPSNLPCTPYCLKFFSQLLYLTPSFTILLILATSLSISLSFLLADSMASSCSSSLMPMSAPAPLRLSTCSLARRLSILSSLTCPLFTTSSFSTSSLRWYTATSSLLPVLSCRSSLFSLLISAFFLSHKLTYLSVSIVFMASWFSLLLS
mmetsp:Transcript_24351/g.50573  ORF Transcript_24351/g.50573 Transcript_24351/m.50573 type:complete len:232 (-) Transcript_24351:949-1644(-)